MKPDPQPGQWWRTFEDGKVSSEFKIVLRLETGEWVVAYYSMMDVWGTPYTRKPADFTKAEACQFIGNDPRF